MMNDRRNSFGGPHFAPVKVGDEFDVTIEAVGEKGDGIAKKDGFVLFVPNTKEGDNVRIRVTRVLRKVGFAEVVGGSSGKSKSSEDGDYSEESEDSQETQEESSEESEEEPAEDSEDFGEEQ